KALAEHLGIHQAAVGKKLMGRRPWQLDELQKVASVLDTDVAPLCSVLPRLDSNQQPSD
ncbi:MAG: BetR domain, partial [Marmoricola sp.]|nr:BetR domain [Marmoricola sp.]